MSGPDMRGGAASLIGVDWGTSSFRAYRIGPDGAMLDQLSRAAGIRSVGTAGFASVLFDHVGPWMDGTDPAPVIMSGMVGSRQGWVEAPYAAMPASLDDIAGGLVTVPHDGPSRIWIVPGLSADNGAMPDVMRGEETQIFGALRQLKRNTGRFVLPGTHSKWVSVEDGSIDQFATYMTGEIFAALRGHTILGSLMAERADLHRDGFRRGLDDGAQAGKPGALLHRLFGARTHALFGRLDKDAVADYLSGLLIGAEFADAAGPTGEPLFIIGAPALADRYILAGECFGQKPERIDADCAAAGLFAIACRAGLTAPVGEN